MIRLLAFFVCLHFAATTAQAETDRAAKKNAPVRTIAPSEFVVAPGFEVSVWAATPQLFNPTNFDVDARGRIWVTEAVNYRNYRNKALGLATEDGDRIVVLEDTDADGKADSSHTFVRDPDLVAPLGIGVIGNRIIVSCSPNILIYTDVDENARFDPKIDTKEVFLTGFRGLDHDHSLHSVKAGPDGYWYFNVGNAGAHTVTDKQGWTLRAGSSYAGGSPHLKSNTPGRKSDDGRIWVGGVGMRIRPDGTGLEPIGHNFRNAYEETVTSFGDVFHADNDDPPACRTSWVMEGSNAGFASVDGTRSWRIDQRPEQSIRVAEWRQEDPGILPAGDVYGNGAPTGVVYGENGCFDKRYPQGLLLVCESARGEVFGYEPRPQGAGFALERFKFLGVKTGSADHGSFRPSDVAIGADGAIYVSDWYDSGVGGHRMTDPGASGAIYRIAPVGFQPKPEALDLSTTEGQIRALKSPAVNVRSLGFEALKKNDSHPISELSELIDGEHSFFAARAVWLLPYLGNDGLTEVVKLLRHDNPQMRITAFRALRRAQHDVEIRDRIPILVKAARASLCSDVSPAVRREAALSLRDVPFDECRDLLELLAAGYDGWDRWYLEALGTACDGKEAAAYDMLVQSKKVDPIRWDRRTTGLAWRLHPPASIDALTARAMSPALPRVERKRMINSLAFIKDRRAAEGMLRLATKGPKDLRELAAWWGKSRHSNDWKAFKLGNKFPNVPRRKKSKAARRPQLDFELASQPVFESTGGEVEIDIDLRGAKRLYLVVDSVGKASVSAKWTQPILVQSDGSTELTSIPWKMAFSNGLTTWSARKDEPKWRKPPVLSEPVLIPAESPSKQAASIAVRGRSIIAYDISGRNVQRFQVRGSIDTEFAKSSGDVRFSVHVDESDAGDAMPPIAELLKTRASSTLGRALFFSKSLRCVQCHTASSFGGEIGPDLTKIASKHAPSVLFEDILKPSAAIAAGFETRTVVTTRGQVVSGLLISGGDPIVVKDVDGKFHTFAKSKVAQTRPERTSLMPEFKQQLTATEVASIVAFLKSLSTK